MRGEDAELEDGGGGGGFKQQREGCAEAAPDGGARGVIEECGGSGAGFAGIAFQVARVTIHDFRWAGESGAELRFARAKPISNRRERRRVGAAVFPAEGGAFRRGGSLRCEDLRKSGAEDV